MIIKSKKDAKQFVEWMKDCQGESNFTFEDSKIQMINGGYTRITYNSDTDTFSQFSFGRGWEDQAPSIIHNPERFIYTHRGDINKEIRRREMR